MATCSLMCQQNRNECLNADQFFSSLVFVPGACVRWCSFACVCMLHIFILHFPLGKERIMRLQKQVSQVQTKADKVYKSTPECRKCP